TRLARTALALGAAIPGACRARGAVAPAAGRAAGERSADRRGLAAAQRAHRGKEVAHLTLRNAAGDEDDAARAVLIGPGRKLDRRMGEVLDHVHHDRSAAARDVEQALHAQEVAPAQGDERLHGAGESIPRQRRVVAEDEAEDAVAVRGLGEEA